MAATYHLLENVLMPALTRAGVDCSVLRAEAPTDYGSVVRLRDLNSSRPFDYFALVPVNSTFTLNSFGVQGVSTLASLFERNWLVMTAIKYPCQFVDRVIPVVPVVDRLCTVFSSKVLDILWPRIQTDFSADDLDQTTPGLNNVSGAPFNCMEPLLVAAAYDHNRAGCITVVGGCGFSARPAEYYECIHKYLPDVFVPVGHPLAPMFGIRQEVVDRPNNGTSTASDFILGG